MIKSCYIVTTFGGSVYEKNNLVRCTESSVKWQETIEIVELNNGSIHAAEYLTKVPPKEVLEKNYCRR